MRLRQELWRVMALQPLEALILRVCEEASLFNTESWYVISLS